MKKLLFAMSIILIYSCSIFRPSPKKTLSEFFESMKKMDSAKVSKLTGGNYVVNYYLRYFDVFYGVLSDDKKRELASVILSKLNYEIMGANVEKNSAKVRVKVTGVEKYDLMRWYDSVHGDLVYKYRTEWRRKHGMFGPPPPIDFFLLPILSEKEKSEYENIAYTKFKNYINQAQTKTRIIVIYLSKENSHWIIDKYSEIFEYFL